MFSHENEEQPQFAQIPKIAKSTYNCITVEFIGEDFTVEGCGKVGSRSLIEQKRFRA
jgi:hypothetical protein